MPIRDLVEEAKKRIVFLAICVIGLSYLMSCKLFLFSSSPFYFFIFFLGFCFVLRLITIGYKLGFNFVYDQFRIEFALLNYSLCDDHCVNVHCTANRYEPFLIELSREG